MYPDDKSISILCWSKSKVKRLFNYWVAQSSLSYLSIPKPQKSFPVGDWNIVKSK